MTRTERLAGVDRTSGGGAAWRGEYPILAVTELINPLVSECTFPGGAAVQNITRWKLPPEVFSR
jgi:hypothetical protein